jgi:hypothetical protein
MPSQSHNYIYGVIYPRDASEFNRRRFDNNHHNEGNSAYWFYIFKLKNNINNIINVLMNMTPKLNFVALVREGLYRQSGRRLSAKLVSTFCGQRVLRGQRGESLRPYSRFSKPEPLLFLSSSSRIVLTRLSGSRSRPTTTQ